ncbi:keratin-associated protein 27-1 [Sorex araneus]|uniref:keratin-associated protein 27-1 n=1 Tax=Sorex araneus TaxID=42254 RepID=UPI00033159C2|nr:keratin-associated protein 27-1 [Sorex araneus]
MSQGRCYSLRSTYNAPPLSAINHGCHPISLEEGLIIPSSCHGRTWLLDNFQESCSETSSKGTNREQEMCREEGCSQTTCHSGGVQTACSKSRCWEKTTCQSQSSSATSECVSQSCQPGNSQQMGFGGQRGPAFLVKRCPHDTYVRKSYQSLECQSSQCQSQGSEPRACSLASAGKRLLKSSSTHEPTCCITGGL